MTVTYTGSTTTRSIRGGSLKAARRAPEHGSCQAILGHHATHPSIDLGRDVDFFRRLVDQDRVSMSSSVLGFFMRPTAALPPGARNNARALALLQKWLADDSDYDERVWPVVKQAIEKNRMSDRAPFNG